MQNNAVRFNPDLLLNLVGWLRGLGLLTFGLWLLGWFLVIFNVWNSLNSTASPNPVSHLISLLQGVLNYLAFASVSLACWAAAETIYVLLDIEENTRPQSQ